MRMFISWPALRWSGVKAVHLHIHTHTHTCAYTRTLTHTRTEVWVLSRGSQGDRTSYPFTVFFTTTIIFIISIKKNTFCHKKKYVILRKHRPTISCTASSQELFLKQKQRVSVNVFARFLPRRIGRENQQRLHRVKEGDARRGRRRFCCWKTGRDRHWN